MSVAEQRVFKLVEKESFEAVSSGEMGHEGDDGVLAGVGVVDGRYAAVYATDPALMGGSLGVEGLKKIKNLYSRACRDGIPIICLSDSAGARIQEGPAALHAFGELFRTACKAKGHVPMISSVLGGCVGGMAFISAFSDVVVGSRSRGYMFINGPRAAEHFVGEKVSLHELGGLELLERTAGTVHLVAEDEDSAIQCVRRVLSYLPQDGSSPVVSHETSDIPDRAIPAELFDEGWEASKALAELCDKDSVLELRPNYGRAVSTFLGRIDAIPVGIVATNPAFNKGMLDVHASVKTAEFVRMCGSFKLPVITVVDTPGFAPGKAHEQAGIVRHAAEVFRAYAETRMPKITVIVGRAYGGAYICLGSKSAGAAYVIATHEAEIAATAPQVAVETVYIKRHEKTTEEEKRKLADEMRARFSGEKLLSTGAVDEVVEIAQIRSKLSEALRKIQRLHGERSPAGRI